MCTGMSSPRAEAMDEETQAQRDALGRLADLLSERGLGMVAVFMLETGKPLSFIAGQSMLFFEPFLEAFGSPRDYRLIAEGLENRENVEWVIRRLEVAEEKRSRRHSDNDE